GNIRLSRRGVLPDAGAVGASALPLQASRRGAGDGGKRRHFPRSLSASPRADPYRLAQGVGGRALGGGRPPGGLPADGESAARDGRAAAATQGAGAALFEGESHLLNLRPDRL